MAPETALWKHNPWWESKEKVAGDPKLVQWEESGIRYDPILRGQIRYDYEPDNTVIYTLRGTRQVGKTTLIKLQIRDFVESGVNPWNIFYYAFDMTESRSEMADVISAYLRLSARKKSQGRTYMFLDEVTSVAEWQKGIKWLVDNGDLADCTVLATGSQAASMLHSAERLSGRRGRISESYDKILRPMRFSEFARVEDGEVAQFLEERGLASTRERQKIALEVLSGGMPDVLDVLHGRFADALEGLLRAYMLAGGIPGIVSQKSKTGSVRGDLYANYRNGILADWGPGQEDVLKQISRALIDSACSAVSWNDLRRQADIASWGTARDYLLSLKDLSIIAILHEYGHRDKSPRLSKGKKFYFEDPFYLHMFKHWSGDGDPFERSEALLEDAAWAGKVAEGVVAGHLIRLAEDASDNPQGFSYSDSVFFWRGEQRREVDFVFKKGALEAPLEVKYRNCVDHRELGGLAKFLDVVGVERGAVLSKDSLEQRRDYSVVPVSEFLLMI